jgi:hypothetical protein
VLVRALILFEFYCDDARPGRIFNCKNVLKSCQEMRKSVPSINVLRILQVVGVAALCVLLPVAADSPHFLNFENSGEREAPLRILKKIHEEVKELGNYPGEDFIKREFFIGRGDDDTNKDLHIVILIQPLEGGETMKIQVTFMEPTRDDPNVRYAKTVKNIACTILEKKVTVQSSDYDRNELEKLVPDILQAIRDKKKLLRLIKNNALSSPGLRPGSAWLLLSFNPETRPIPHHPLLGL